MLSSWDFKAPAPQEAGDRGEAPGGPEPTHPGLERAGGALAGSPIRADRPNEGGEAVGELEGTQLLHAVAERIIATVPAAQWPHRRARQRRFDAAGTRRQGRHHLHDAGRSPLDQGQVRPLHRQRPRQGGRPLPALLPRSTPRPTRSRPWPRRASRGGCSPRRRTISTTTTSRSTRLRPRSRRCSSEPDAVFFATLKVAIDDLHILPLDRAAGVVRAAAGGVSDTTGGSRWGRGVVSSRTSGRCRERGFGRPCHRFDLRRGRALTRRRRFSRQRFPQPCPITGCSASHLGVASTRCLFRRVEGWIRPAPLQSLTLPWPCSSIRMPFWRHAT